LVRAFRTNERVNQVLLELLDPAVWRACPPCSKRRNIATPFAHIHNVRLMRLKMSGKGIALPARLDRAEVTREAHHRGQITHWARQLGAPIEAEQAFRLWEWDKRWKEAAG